MTTTIDDWTIERNDVSVRATKGDGRVTARSESVSIEGAFLTAWMGFDDDDQPLHLVTMTIPAAVLRKMLNDDALDDAFLEAVIDRDRWARIALEGTARSSELERELERCARDLEMNAQIGSTKAENAWRLGEAAGIRLALGKMREAR